MKPSPLLLLISCIAYLYLSCLPTLFGQTQLFPYRQGQKWGYVTAKKKVIIPIQYHFADKFINGRAWVQNDKKKWAMIDATGKPLTGFAYDGYGVMNDTTFRVYSNLIGVISDDASYNDILRRSQVNIINLDGQLLLPWRYSWVQQFGKKYWLVNIDIFKDSLEQRQLADKTVLLDSRRHEIIFPQIDSYETSFDEGLVLVYTHNNLNYIDTLGRYLLPNQGNTCKPFQEGFARIITEEGGALKEHFINTRGQRITKKSYEHQMDFDDYSFSPGGFQEGLAVVSLQNKHGYIEYGYIDTLGNEVIAPQYKKAMAFREGLAVVKEGNKYGVINKQNQLVVPFQYDKIQDYHNGYAIFELDQYQGVLDKQGKEIVTAMYDKIWDFEYGKAAVKFEDKIGFIDTTGREVIPVQYPTEHGAYKEHHYSTSYFYEFDKNMVYLPNWGWLGHDGTAFFETDTLSQNAATIHTLSDMPILVQQQTIKVSQYRRLLLDNWLGITINTIDLDNDGRKELVITAYNRFNAQPLLEIYELTPQNYYQQTVSGTMKLQENGSKVRILRDYSQDFLTFHSCSTCWVSPFSPVTSFEYYYEQGKLLLPPIDTIKNQQLSLLVEALQKQVEQIFFITSCTSRDAGEKKLLLYYLLAYYINNHRAIAPTKALFDQYYWCKEDKKFIWKEILGILKKY